MDYQSKTNWQLGEKVLQTDINKWEQGITDLFENAVFTDASRPFLAPQKGVMPVDNDDLATKQFVLDASNSNTKNSINSGNIDANGNADILHTPGSGTATQSWISPAMTAMSQDGYTVTTNMGSTYNGQGFKAFGNFNGGPSQLFNWSANGNWTQAWLQLNFPTPKNITKIYFPLDGANYGYGGDNTSSWNIKGFYQGVEVFSYTQGPRTVANVQEILCDSIRVQALNWANPDWLGYSPVKIEGYEVISVSTADKVYFKVGGAYSALTMTNYKGIKTNLDIIPTFAVPSNKPYTTFNLFLKSDGGLDHFPKAIRGKDLYVDFSLNSAEDNYILHDATIQGSPTFTGGKYTNNGSSGLRYNGITHGPNPWCKIVKFKSINTSTLQTIMSTVNQYCTSIDKTTANKLAMYCSSNNTSWDIAAGAGAALGTKSDWGINTDYYIRHYFTRTQYKLDWSTDYNPLTGEGTWTNDITVNSTLALTPTAALTFGMYGFIKGQPLIGTISFIQVTIGSSMCINKSKETVGRCVKFPMLNDIWYDTSAEPAVQKRYNGSSWQEYKHVKAGSISTNANSYVETVVQPLFNKNGYNGGQDLSSLGMPSASYIDLTLGASGSTYIAPADGWLAYSCNATGNNIVEFRTILSAGFNKTIGNWTLGNIQCKSGENVQITYLRDGTISSSNLRFVYAEGSKP